MGKWRDKLGVARDTVDDVKFRVTDKFIRCSATDDDGTQCDQDKGHSGSHTNVNGSW